MADEIYGRSELNEVKTVFLGDEPATYDAVEGVLFLGASRWTEARQAFFVASLKQERRPVLFGNPDLVTASGGMSIRLES